MRPYTHIFFDLDGTLTDPGLGITNSVMYALERYGIHVTERSELYSFIGPSSSHHTLPHGCSRSSSCSSMRFISSSLPSEGR